MSKTHEIQDATGIIEKLSGRGIVEAWGKVAPSNSVAGYAPGCIWHNVAGAAGTAFYINTGTVTSSTWIELTGIAGGTLSGPLVVTSTSANALAVGPAGATNGTFVVDASTASDATGLKVTGAAAAAGVALQVISSGTDENLTINAKGAGTVTLNGTATGTVTIGANLTMADAKNVVLNGTTGTKIGTATSQKIGFWNQTPTAQPSATGQTSGFTAGAGSAVLSDSTFTGGTGSTAYTVGDLVKHLKTMGLIAS